MYMFQDNPLDNLRLLEILPSLHLHFLHDDFFVHSFFPCSLLPLAPCFALNSFTVSPKENYSFCLFLYLDRFSAKSF